MNSGTITVNLTVEEAEDLVAEIASVFEYYQTATQVNKSKLNEMGTILNAQIRRIAEAAARHPTPLA